MRLIARIRMYPANTPPHVYIRIENADSIGACRSKRANAMADPKHRPSTDDIADAGELSGISISEAHAGMVAKSSDALFDAFEVVRSLDYQDHEPSNVFNPVVLTDASDEGSNR